MRALIRARGLTLIECMIALVVLAIGLLGMAGLILRGLRAGHDALLRTQAVNLVTDMAERIRANPAAAGAYDCASYTGAPRAQECASTETAAGANCTASELAEDDLARWQDAARAALPLAQATCAANVEYTAASAIDAPARYRVSVSWIERGEPELATYSSDLLLVPPP
ncbi:MAG TPA: type IV pilus modification protein PilV [Steroidobacteraceae bacterium]|nr:type IV pilus modification protein PilV [Steroidobacteraceae bacterium]